jgi:secretion/DNA translocation related TadE-like protein
MRRRDESGAATVLVLAMVGVLAFVTIGLAAGASLFRSQRQAQSAADLAVLAAASAQQRGDDGCAAARAVAAANAARVVDCQPGTDDVRLSVEVDGPRWRGRHVSVAARARAGPARSQ